MELHKYFDIKLNSSLDIEEGNFLLSEPMMPDKIFQRSVILICKYNKKEGAIGLIINKPALYLTPSNNEDILKNKDLFIGGPVKRNIFQFIHSIKDIKNSIHLYDNLYWGGDFMQFESLLSNKTIDQSSFRGFVGYAEWAHKQLEEELKDNSWIIYRERIPDIFNRPPNNLWYDILNSMSRRHKMLANYPVIPNLN